MVRARKPDGRAGNGGVRVGTPGSPYVNRSDMRQAATVAPNQPYGQAGAQLAAQKAVPLAAAPPAPTPPAGGAGPAATSASPSPPADLYRPTERPDEPVTHGLPLGPGAGPEALRVLGAPNAAMSDPLAIQLRALYAKYPSQELADLLTDIR